MKDKPRNCGGGVFSIRILLGIMFAGNPKPARAKAFCAIALAIVIAAALAVLATRKKTPPMRVEPLHPSIFMVTAA
jgi:hypothetical protein